MRPKVLMRAKASMRVRARALNTMMGLGNRAVALAESGRGTHPRSGRMVYDGLHLILARAY